MKDYIAGNKEAWEEAFAHAVPEWGDDIASRINGGDYSFYNEDMASVLKGYELAGKTVGQFCCNNGRELLCLVANGGAERGIGFDIAENQVDFANGKARELGLPCEFVCKNVLDIDSSYGDTLDFVIITIGALCWFKDLDAFFSVVSRCMKKGGVLVINEQHPCTNMLAAKDEDCYDPEHPLDCSKYSYFSHEWHEDSGMFYMARKAYESKMFIDFTHPYSEIVNALCHNNMVITGMQEFDYDISETFEELGGMKFPLSYIIEAEKQTRAI